jgi:hypothetical protein
MGNPMEIATQQFSYSADDIIRANKVVARPEIRKHRLMGVGTLVLLLLVAAPAVATYAVVVRYMPEDAAHIWSLFWNSWARWGWLAAFPAGAILSRYLDLLLWPGRVRRAHRKDSSNYRNVQATFSDEGVHITWPNADLRCEWPYLSGVIESADYFLLKLAEQYTAVPKRALSEADVPALAEMLRRRVTKYEKFD